tara:strand:- start:598 stop:813 length:216 start_codon:yes stop_codon:yes gene_type:complete
MNNSPEPLYNGPLFKSNGTNAQPFKSLPALPALPEPPELIRANAAGQLTTLYGTSLAEFGRNILQNALGKN